MARHDTRGKRRAALVLLLISVVAVGCGGSDSAPTSPTPTTYTLSVQVRNEQQTAVANALARIIDGSNAGRNATSDQSGLATISGLSPGGFTLEVTAAGYGQAAQAVTLSGSQTVTVQMKLTPNLPPVIASLVVQGTYPNEPQNYVDAGEVATVTAKIVDSETAADKMTYEWKADVGTITGTGGNSAKWQPPSNVGGSGVTSATLGVTVIEKYGPSDSLENKVSSEVKVSVHDSKKESADVASVFLADFSNSLVSADTAVRNFSASLCAAGKAEEFAQITDNRKRFKITSSAIGQATTIVNFGGTCNLGKPGDSCVSMTCEWRSTYIDPTDPKFGTSDHVKGVCYLTTVFDSTRDAWKMCWSNFTGDLLPTGWRF